MQLSGLQSRIGQQITESGWLLITQERVSAFADVTGDHQFIHTDPERAAATPLGGTIAHGFLTLSLLAGELSGGAIEIQGTAMTVNYGLNRVRFVTPVRIGRRVRNRGVLQSAEEGPGYVQLTVLNTVEIEGEDRPAMVAETLMRVYTE
ncbi:MaoC family dehydratase [Deinococcus sp.]|uniref:MaoC family dehydratase n=1 Tax=Deinococcus sp. TaxID=47478 RepID=UPI0025E55987|nr:MaoC family dehydratase [Deinococcus sp.]